MLLVIILNKLSVVICAIILIAKMLGNIMQNVVTLGAIKWNAIKLTVVVLNDMAPLNLTESWRAIG